MHLRNVLLSAVICAVAVQAQTAEPPVNELERTQWFREAKFGMFIHWGPYAVVGRHEWARHRFEIPQDEYDRYARAFNPVQFDANTWVDLAQNAGAKYMVITSKHHDGFSIYRSKVSDYDMEITPYEGDPLKLLAEASQRKGMRLGFYHSIMDWHHPDYRPRRAWESSSPNAGGDRARYIEFMKAQLQELLTEFGPVAMIWFDGEWEDTLRDPDREDEIYQFIRGLQPNTLINDRLYQRRAGNPADFGTPEQFVPATGLRDAEGSPLLWESCVTINMDSWGYNKYETEFKTERDLIRMLIEVVSKGGNLLLNVGPMPDGRIQPEFVTRLEAIGSWMRVNSEAIYGTEASPFARLPFFGRATTKDNKLYLHVFQWPKDRRLLVPGLKNPVQSAYLLADPETALPISHDNAETTVMLPEQAPDEIATVVVLTLDGKPIPEPYLIRPDQNGILTLGAESLEIRSSLGQRAKKENALGHVFLTNWTRAGDVPVWTFALPRAGRYNVDITYGLAGRGDGRDITVASGSTELTAATRPTGNEWVFGTQALGEMNLPAGEQTLEVRIGPEESGAINLEQIILSPAP